MKLYQLAFMVGREPLAGFAECKIRVAWGGLRQRDTLQCYKLAVLAVDLADAKNSLHEIVQAVGGTVQRIWLLKEEPLCV